jgi:acyl carrier protein
MDYSVEKIMANSIERFNNENETFLTYKKDLNLMGTQSVIDSLGLVQLIVVIEEEVENATGKTISLVSEKAMSLKNSPFRTIEALEDYIGELVQNGQ